MKKSEVIAVIEPGQRVVVKLAPQQAGETYAQALARQEERSQRIRDQLARKLAQRT